MRNLFSSLEEQYGEDFNWYLLPENKTYFNDEAYREIHPEHPLYGCVLQSIAKCESNDDVLYRSEIGSSSAYYVIHLTYSKQNTGESPLFTRLDNLGAVRSFIETNLND